MAAARGDRRHRPRDRAARGLHHPVGVQPRRRARGRRRRRRPRRAAPATTAPATRSASRRSTSSSCAADDRRGGRAAVGDGDERHPHRRHRPHRPQARRARCATRGDEVTVLSRVAREGAARRWASTAVALGPDGRPGAGRGAARPRRGRPPRRRARRPALDDDVKRADPREPRDRDAQPRRGPARRPSRRPEVLVSSSAVGYYGKHGDERVPESTPAGDDFLAGVCVAWEREADAAAELGLRVVQDPHRRRARQGRRRAEDDAAAVQARRRRPGRRRRPVPAVDPRRRPRRHLPRTRWTTRRGRAPTTARRPSR